VLQMSTVNLQIFRSSRMRKDQSSKDTKERTFAFSGASFGARACR